MTTNGLSYAPTKDRKLVSHSSLAGGVNHQPTTEGQEGRRHDIQHNIAWDEMGWE